LLSKRRRDADDLHRLIPRAGLSVGRHANHLADRILTGEQLRRKFLIDDRDTWRGRGALFCPGELAAADHAESERLEVVGADHAMRSRPYGLTRGIPDQLEIGAFDRVAERH